MIRFPSSLSQAIERDCTELCRRNGLTVQETRTAIYVADGLARSASLSSIEVMQTDEFWQYIGIQGRTAIDPLDALRKKVALAIENREDVLMENIVGKQSQVTAQIARQDDALLRLADMIGKLEERLDCILCPETAAKSQGETEQELVHLAREMRDITCGIEGQAEKVSQIISRLEL